MMRVSRHPFNLYLAVFLQKDVLCPEIEAGVFYRSPEPYLDGDSVDGTSVVGILTKPATLR
jgi:hypothetical protein